MKGINASARQGRDETGELAACSLSADTVVLRLESAACRDLE